MVSRIWALWAFRNKLGKFLIASRDNKFNFNFLYILYTVYIFDVDEHSVLEKSIEITLFEFTTLESIDQFDQTLTPNANT